MIKKKNVYISIGIVCLALFMCVFILYLTTTESKEVVVPFSEEKAITMKEAIAMAYEEVIKLSDDAKLVAVTSADASDQQVGDSGESGKRVHWNLKFTDSKTIEDGVDNTPTTYVIYISEGRFIRSVETKFGNNTKIEDSDLILDSSDAVTIAKNQKGLKPGENWAIGYHFVMRYFPIDEDQKTERLILEVVGLSPNGNFANVYIDEKTGEIVESIEKTYDDQGNTIWTDF